MTVQPRDWRQLCDLAQSEKDAQKQNELCDHARRVIQERSIDLAEVNARNAAEENDLNAALRQLWKVQNRS